MLVVLLLPASGFAGSSQSDPATSIYVEHPPSAAGTSGAGRKTSASPRDAATSIYVEQPPAATGTGSTSTSSGAKSLEQLLTSPTLGAPQAVQPIPGDVSGSDGTFSFATVRAVAGVGTARLVALLAALVLITVTIGATAISTLSKR
jgi:hypothetical protein